MLEAGGAAPPLVAAGAPRAYFRVAARAGAGYALAVQLGINPIVTLEKRLLNIIR